MIILKNARITAGTSLKHTDILIINDRIFEIGDNINHAHATIYDLDGALVIPGAIDVHTHLREPGFTHKETIKSGTAAAARGGVTSIMSMPNLSPVTDSVDELNSLKRIIDRDALVNVYPYAALTKNQKGEIPSDIEGLAPLVKAFSDDGVCVNSEKLLLECMIRVKKANSIIASHAEFLGAVNSRDAEVLAVERELRVVEQTKCPYHFCHISTSDAFDMIRKARMKGLNVTCEVTPHHLILNESDNKCNTNFKMNPPLRSKADYIATREALLDLTASIIATDHAPHSKQEKALEYSVAPNGIIGLETFIPLIYTEFVKTGLITFERMIECITYNPARRFNLEFSQLKKKSKADLAVIAIDEEKEFKEDEIVSLSKNSPFIGRRLYGNNILTLVGGIVKYKDQRFSKNQENINKGENK